MLFQQLLLTLKRYCTAIIILAAGILIAFSTACGKDASADANEAAADSAAPKTVRTGTGKEDSEKSDNNVKPASENAAQQNKPEETSVPTRPKRTMSIGIRKIYAPESEIQKWPLGNNKFTTINAQEFELKYKLWKYLFSNNSSDPFFTPPSSDVYIQSARYYGSVNESGELSGWGEWKVVVNQQVREERISAISNYQSAIDSSVLFMPNIPNNPYTLLLTPSSLKILLSDFVFYDSSVEKLPEPESELEADKESPFQVDSETYYPVDKGVVSANFPNGQTVLYIPSEGTIRFRWKAKRLEPSDYQIQAPGSVESLWTIDVPSDKKLTLRSDDSDSSTDSLCAVIVKEKNEKSSLRRYSIRWSESETAVVHIGSADEKENLLGRFYQQQTTYKFTQFNLNTQCRITFEPDSRSAFPQEIPFSVAHDPQIVWEASFDGQPAEINITESGYSVSLSSCKTDNPQPELIITSNCSLDEVKNESREASSSKISSLFLPRIELQSGRWQSGTAIIYTLQSPKSVETDKCNVINSKRVAFRQYQTTVEQNAPDADVVLSIEPYKELFYSQTETVVQWDGSQASFISSIDLHAEEGRLYSLTASLPEGLIIDQASSEEQPDMIEDWEVYSDSENPAKRTLTIYLRKSLCPGQGLFLNIRSHAIADWSKPVELNRLAPIVFDRFESHTQTLFVNVAINQRFLVGERVLYSPEQEMWSSDSAMTPELPIGIECSPHTSTATESGTGRIDAYEFCIDLKMWGNCLASLEPIQSNYTVNAKTTVWADQNSMEERIELAFSGERSHVNQFRFSYGNPSEASIAWQGLMIWANNQYKIKVEPVEGSIFAFEIPRNVSSPFTVILSRKFDWNQQRSFEALKSNDCSRLTSSVSVFSRTPQLFDIHTYGMKYIKSDTDNNADFTIGTYEYELKDLANEAEQISLENQDAEIESAGKDASSAADSTSESRSSQSALSDSALSPRIELSLCKVPKSDVSIWAWNQLVEERHFISGNILTSAQWTIENRFPPQNLISSSNTSNTQLKITLPSGPAYRDYKKFLTGVRIDNESVGGDAIIRESENSYVILLPPKKKVFVLTVQWASFDQQLNNYSAFELQKPILSIPTLQSSWNLYYPASYRRMNSFLSYDSTVDGWLERIFGPLLRRDSNNILGLVSQIWDEAPENQGQEAGKKELGNNESEIVNNNSFSVKTDSNSVTYTPSGFSTWNCCRFDGHDAPHNIWIIRSEVSECIRWIFFIITVSTILTLYFKRSEKKSAQRDASDSASEVKHSTNGNGALQIRSSAETSSRHGDEALENKNQNGETANKPSWGFRRWVCVFCGICGILCQTLPWLLSLPFSGAFLGMILCLLVLAVPFKREKTKGYEEPTFIGKSTSIMILNSRTSTTASRIFFFVFMLTLCQSLGGQTPLPPSTEGYIEQGAEERKEFEIFIPVDKENRPNPNSGYYVPQELLDLTQANEKISPKRSWIVYRTQYYGKLFQKPRQTESGLWECVMEIETLAPNVVLDLPIQLPEMITTTSNISVSRGQILKSPKSNPDEETSENAKSELLYWSWNKLDNQAFLQLNPQNELGGIRLAQPGRYLIEVEFRPTIVTVDNKNLISFSVLECANSTLELLVPENITGLEFPNSYGGVVELTPNMEIPDPSIPVQPGLKLKRIQLGATKQLAVRWNAGGFLSDGPVFDVDTITWWNVTPESVDVKIKYNVSVVSGAVSSLGISADERLALSNEELGIRNSESNNSSFRVTKSELSPGAITVDFDNPVTSRTTFELHYIWKDAVGVGRLQFPTTSVESSRSGQRALAFTFDPRLQYECASESLKPMSAQSFWELWRGFQKQNASVADAENEKKSDSGIRNSELKNTAKPSSSPTAVSSQTPVSNALPTVAYDLNLSRRKTDSSGVVDSVVMNVQRTKASSEGKAEAFVLADWDRILWQIKWTIDITRGERSGFTAVLPESMCRKENSLSIISALIETSDNASNHSSSVSASIDGNELKLYWGAPVEGKCQLTITGELRPNIENESSESPWRVGFGFPEIKTLNVAQYKLAIGRTDDSAIQTIFDRPTSQTVVWTQAELPVESPFSSRNQRLMETWQTTINDSSKKPCALVLEVQKNNVSTEIDATIKLAPDNSSALVVKGRIKVNDGILDEFLLDVPENCGAPVSSKATLNCQLDKLSITQQRYYLRPLSPYTSDNEFELTIPLNKPMSGNWKLEKRNSLLWSVVRSSSPQTTASVEQLPTRSSQQSQTRVFGLKMFVSPISENEYCATAEFACAVSGSDSVLIQLPKGSRVLNVQLEQRSVRWIENKADQILAPIFTDNDPVDVRIVYTSSLSRNIYADPMVFEPPTIESAQQPEILWMVLPWKNFSHPEPTAVRTTSFINEQIWLIDELNRQFQFLKSSGNVSRISIERLSSKLDAIEFQLKQYENRGEKKKTRSNSVSLIPSPKKIQSPNKTSSESGTIHLAMQNVLRLREALRNAKSEIRYSELNNSEDRNSQLPILNSQSSPAAGLLVGTSAPQTAFILNYSLPPTAAPNISIWQILSMLFIPVIIWLAFFPPEPFIIWRPSFVLGCLSVIWLIYFNLYGVSILLFIIAVFDAVSKMRQLSKRKIIPLSVR